ncbi:SDR family NAD(P)-dependent oxidoreductase [Burkholderia plantarii]|uniref:SDR family NAD(P)-dependent oxidoreductase n=1 Tax=Burkholderia plantarii TaxID=41899 RepID=UPI0018DE4D36|nr:SDR family oxidoreductase [Burkholderia plantarii]MBI0325742.1 SDR family oxidoreductase [Burkholderia plantarii]
MANVFISGISSGIGHALAAHYLERGWTVYGVSRRRPETLPASARLIHRRVDLTAPEAIEGLFDGAFAPLAAAGADLVYLNAGTAGTAPRRAAECPLDELQRTLMLNAVANKLLLDAFLALPRRPATVVASASIGGVRFRAGMLGYSMSKAALIALCGVYAEEYPEVFFAVLGMCNVDTALSREIVDGPRVEAFPDHVRLRERFATPGYAASPRERAADVFDLLHPVRDARLASGRFVEMRALLASRQADGQPA